MKNSSLTDGPIGQGLWLFTLPLIFGNLFQQLYNAADTVIVGRFVNDNALAAVGSSGPIINLLISLFMGVGIGAGVVIARYYGAGDMDAADKTIHTTVVAGIVAGAFMSVVGVLFTPTLLRWMDTPAAVMSQSLVYFRIYFAGSLFSILYNFGSSVFRALGDSRRPLYYLIISSVVNIILDLLFVAVLRWGVAGAAWATVLSNGLSVLLVFYKLSTGDGPLRLRLSMLRCTKRYLIQIIQIGLPSGFQNAVGSLSNVVIQSGINSFGEIAMAGTAAYRKIDGFAQIPTASFSMALSTFVSQNLGAGRPDRAKKGANVGLVSTMAMAELVGVIVFIFAWPITALFSSSDQVIQYGVDMARTIVPFYFLLAYSHGMAGVLRGAGLAKVPMFVMMFCWCVFRVIWIQVMSAFIHDISIVYVTYPITWSISGVIFTIYYFKSNWAYRCDYSPNRQEVKNGH